MPEILKTYDDLMAAKKFVQASEVAIPEMDRLLLKQGSSGQEFLAWRSRAGQALMKADEAKGIKPVFAV